jgi:hypothetical protein
VDGGHREQAGATAAPDQQRLVGERFEVASEMAPEGSGSAAPPRTSAPRRLRRGGGSGRRGRARALYRRRAALGGRRLRRRLRAGGDRLVGRPATGVAVGTGVAVEAGASGARAPPVAIEGSSAART